jgi:WD40 repeat protein
MEKKEKNSKTIKLIKEFTKNEDCIIYLLRLKDGNLITCSQDKEINIYQQKTFDILLSWNGHLNSINCLCELNNSRIASCSDDKRIAIWKYDLDKKTVFQEIIFIAHSSFINKIITLNDDNIASCSEDNNIYIWNSQPPYNKKCSLKGYNSEVTSIIQLKNKKIVSTCGNKENGLMKIWTLDENNDKILQIESVKEAFCYCINSLVEIEGNKVVVGGYKYIRVVNINQKIIEAKIECHICLICSIIILNDGSIVSASEEGSIVIINNIFYDKLNSIDFAHDLIIFSLCVLNNDSFCSSSKDGVIKIWSYK